MTTPATPATMDGSHALAELRDLTECRCIDDDSGCNHLYRGDVEAVAAALGASEERVTELTAQLVECFRLAGADPDGPYEAKHAERAVQAVADLRRDYDDDNVFKDAERYRWLRAEHDGGASQWHVREHVDHPGGFASAEIVDVGGLDAAIDALLARKEGKE